MTAVLDWIDPTFHATEVILTALVLVVLTYTVLRASPERMRARIAAKGLVPAFRRSAATNTIAALIALETTALGTNGFGAAGFGVDLTDLGLRPVTVGDVLIALLLPAAAAGTAALLAVRSGPLAPGDDPLAFLRPANPAERRWAAVAALAAGVGEEVVFRGLLIAAGVGVLGLPAWAAAVLAAVLFGVGHRYQGLRGVIVTTAAAAVFTALYALTGNLLIPIALHVTVDLVSLLLVPALLARNTATGTAGTAGSAGSAGRPDEVADPEPAAS